jgi:hypothetical protein
VALGDRLLSFGGADQFDPERMRANALGMAAEYDARGKQWRPLKAKIQPREGLVAARTERAVYLVGGMPEGADRPVDVVERFDLETGKVTPYGTLSTGLVTPAVSVVGRRMLVIGGVTNPPHEVTAEIQALDLE